MNKPIKGNRNTTITKKLVGNAAQLTRSSRGIGALIVQHLAAGGADLASVFVTNGGYNGVQQVLRLSTRLFAKGASDQTATNA
jgi:hypothetical protein